LDIVNMFNAVSRESARSALAQHPKFRGLLPFFDLIYGEPNKCWYRKPDNTWDYFYQHEGFAQGCPLAPVLASLVLHQVLEIINQELIDRAIQQNDDTPAFSTSYFDDTSSMLRFPDLLFYLERFTELGPQHGIVLNYGKTKILTSTDGKSPLNLLPVPDAEALQAALDFLAQHPDSQPELTSGVRLLGQPIRSRNFVDSFLQKSLDSFQTDIHRLNQGFPDLQSRSTIFRFCTRPTYHRPPACLRLSQQRHTALHL
jgi:hypothetical protein